ISAAVAQTPADPALRSRRRVRRFPSRGIRNGLHTRRSRTAGPKLLSRRQRGLIAGGDAEGLPILLGKPAGAKISPTEDMRCRAGPQQPLPARLKNLVAELQQSRCRPRYFGADDDFVVIAGRKQEPARSFRHGQQNSVLLLHIAIAYAQFAAELHAS